MRFLTLPAVALALLTGAAVPATAGEDTAAPRAPAVFGSALADSVLQNLRGGTDTSTSSLQLSGTTASNSAYEVTTGNNAIASGAFSGLSGIPLVVQNTGANVLIQNAMILNVRIN